MKMRHLSGLATALLLAATPATSAIGATPSPPLFGDTTTAASGDFDGDGYDDLAVGSPFEDIAGERNAGAVNVVYGSAGGLVASGDQLWHQASSGVPGALERDDRFGWALAVGNFNGDGFDDLAIGIPYETYVVDAKGIVIFGRSAPPDWRIEAGAVVVLYGGTNGLSAKSSKIVHQSRSGVKGKGQREDHFGAALAAGDFDGDGRDELAVGVPGEDRTGAVQVFFGSAGGVSNRDQLWFQKTTDAGDGSERGDGFGSSLTAGNLGYSSREDDLAIGIPGEDIGSSADAGAVQILYGQPGKGLDVKNVPSHFLHQDTAGAEDTVETGDLFGWSLAVGDFGRSAQLDLAVGAPGETVSRTREGAVQVLYGGSFGITTDADQLWRAGAGGLKGSPLPNAEFGRSLAAADFNGSQSDLAVGVPAVDGPKSATGAVHVVHGGPFGLTTTGSVAVATQLWTRAVLGAPVHQRDAFGFALAAGQFGADSAADLAVTAPGADRPPDANTGDVHVLYGRAATGVSATGAQIWNQDSPGIEDAAEPGDGFGGVPVSIRGAP